MICFIIYENMWRAFCKFSFVIKFSINYTMHCCQAQSQNMGNPNRHEWICLGHQFGLNIIYHLRKFLTVSWDIIIYSLLGRWWDSQESKILMYTFFFFIRTKFIRTSKLELPHKTKNICKLSWFCLKNTLYFKNVLNI